MKLSHQLTWDWKLQNNRQASKVSVLESDMSFEIISAHKSVERQIEHEEVGADHYEQYFGAQKPIVENEVKITASVKRTLSLLSNNQSQADVEEIMNMELKFD